MNDRYTHTEADAGAYAYATGGPRPSRGDAWDELDLDEKAEQLAFEKGRR